MTALGAGLAGCSSSTETQRTVRETTASQTTQSKTETDTTTEPTPSETRTETTTEASAESVDVGVVYIPFVGDKFGECTTVSQPELGQYGDPVPSAIATRHASWLADAGVSTVMFNVGESRRDHERLSTFLRADLGPLSVEPFYVISQALRRDRDIEADFEFLRETLLSTDRCHRRDGRPVITFWDFDFLAWGGSEDSKEAKQLVEDRGGPAGFVDYLREQLTVDGTEPFLVGDFADHAVGGFPADYTELNRHLDGATNWIPVQTEVFDWETTRDHVAQSFAATRTFCDEHDMAYHPMTFPGFDDRHNSCWGSGRYIPRAPAHLRELLELAREYSTGRVNVASFNDWTEGHQIEPGRFRDTTYSTDYLDVVAGFTAP
ncbi:hypothetical protein [Haloarchaeobius sp. HME9146]|uniref:hypothetical protein n=1 Tax=Haloarchaeobius sp. HME9146 TaxID=2978732 RepID=UPI0021BFB910|nr:hypothetical protein [Haloarchaeobius sp. HME9146]MCT9096135.1 hypothetical protein [Haloarchaeobius sp. HME9146]